MSQQEISPSNFKKEVAQSDKPVFIDFFAPWCGPCKKMGPIVDEVEQEFEDKLKVVQCNVDENQELANNFQVLKIPTFILFKDGEEVAKMVGAAEKKDLTEMIYKHIE